MAGLRSISVDAICVGHNNFCVPYLQECLYPLGGACVLLEEVGACLTENLTRAMRKSETGTAGALEWRQTPGIEVKQLIGGVQACEESQGRRLGCTGEEGASTYGSVCTDLRKLTLCLVLGRSDGACWNGGIQNHRGFCL